ncbi:hypothetical protein BDR05DRAFT_79845 [Suillus weaverae]|nr:hypothetical protein BDR05DRAFT_79845 [Suillus weaverae]
MDIMEPHPPAHSSTYPSASTKRSRVVGFMLKAICIACHVVPIIVHGGLFRLYMRNFDYTLTYSTRLQVDWGYFFFIIGYETWFGLLTFMTYKLIFKQLFCGEFRLTAVCDILNAMYGSGAALAALWDQRMTATACSEATVILFYIISLTFLRSHATLVLVPTISTNRVHTFVAPALSTWPDATVNTQSWNWPTILSVASKFGQLSPTAIGLGDGFLYDIIPESLGATGNATVTAAEVSVTCFLAQNLSYERSVTNEPLIYTNATITPVLDAIPWKDQVLYLDSPLIEGWLNFLLTTGTAENPSIYETTVQGTWYYDSDPAGNSTWNSIDLHFAICNVSLLHRNASMDVQSNNLLVVPEMSESPPQWTTIPALASFAPEKIVDGGVITMPFETQIFYTGIRTCFDKIDHYPCNRNTSVGELLLMQLIGMPFSSIIPDVPINITQDTAPGGNQYFNTTPSFTISKHQMEAALSRLYATVIWIAGELGDSGGGFQRAKAEVEVTQFVSEKRLELDYTSNFIALLASCWLLALVIRIAGRETGPSIQTSNLSFVWLAKHSQDLTTQFARILHPDNQVLRRAGMFRVGIQDTSRVFAIDNPPNIAGADCASVQIDTKPGVFQRTWHEICGCASISWNRVRSLTFFSLKYKVLGSHEGATLKFLPLTY